MRRQDLLETPGCRAATLAALAALACLLTADAASAQVLKQDSAVIRGRVTDAATGAPLRDVRVSLTTHDGWANEHWRDRTDKDGTYVIDVSPDLSPVHVLFGGLETHDGGWFGGPDLSYEDLPPEALVAFSAGDTVEIDFALQRLTVLHGTVTDEHGRPISRVTVSSIQQDGGLDHTTDEEGRFSFRLHPDGGPVKLRFAEHAMDTTYVYGWFKDAADEESAWAIPVPADDSLRIDAVLPRGEWPVSLSVGVEDETGTPIQGIEVTVWAGTGDSRRVVATGRTSARGHLSFASEFRPSDGPYRVHLADPVAEEYRRTPFRSEWYGDAPSVEEATALWLHAHSGWNDITSSLAPETGEAEPTKLVGGYVRDQYLGDAPGVEVLVHSEDLTESLPAQTNSNGWWGVRVPAALESVQIEYRARDPSQSDAEVVVWYESGSTRDEATAIALGDRDERVDIILTIGPAVVIDGTVLDRAYNPVPDIEVTGYWTDVGRSEQEAELTFRARSGADGTFTARTDAAGYDHASLIVYHLEGPYGDGFHPRGDEFEYALRELAYPGLNPQALFVDFPTAALAGSLTDAAGNPLGDVEVVGWYRYDTPESPDSLVAAFEETTSKKGRFVGLVHAYRSPYFIQVRRGERQVWFGGRDSDGSLRWVRDRKLARQIELAPGDSVAIDGVASMPEQLAGGDDGRLDDIDPRDPGDAFGGGGRDGDAGAGGTPGAGSGSDGPAAAGTTLEGEWVRLDSNNPRNDGMRVRVSGTGATLVYLPPAGSSKHRVGQVQWQGFSGAGSMQVRGSDGQLYPATASLEGDVVQIDVEANGPGNDQTWRRAGPSIQGEWVLVAPGGDPNDGIRIRVEGEEAEVRFVTASADRNLRVGRVLWRDIGAREFKALTTGGGYVAAGFQLLGPDHMRVRLAGASQTWARPAAAEEVRSRLAGDEEAETGEALPAADPWAKRRAVLNITTVRADGTLEGAGDEPWLAVVQFAFRLGELAWTKMFDDPTINPMPVGSHPRSVRASGGGDYMREGETHAVEIVSYPMAGVEPLTVFGLIPVLIEQDGTGDFPFRWAAATCVEEETFAALRRLNDFEPDYADHSSNNVANVVRLLLDRMARLDNALGASIQDKCEEPLRGETLFDPSVAYWIHAPGVSGAQLREWINQGPGPNVIDDFGTFELTERAATNPAVGTPVPASYTFLGNFRLMSP